MDIGQFIHNDSGFNSYKGHPFTRTGDEMYLGNLKDEYMVRLQVVHKNNINGLNVADKIMVYKVSNDPKLTVMESILRKSQVTSLYEALDLAVAWLEHKD
jgi:hypothetical protein